MDFSLVKPSSATVWVYLWKKLKLIKPSYNYYV